MGDKNYSKRGIARKIACLKSFFRFCVINELVEVNIMDKIQNPKTRAENILPKYLEEKEVSDFLNFVEKGENLGIKNGERLYPIVRLMYSVMARVSEICNLSIKDVNFDAQTILLYGKGGKQRVVPFDETTRDVLFNMIFNRILEDSKYIPIIYNTPKDQLLLKYILENGDEPLFRSSTGSRMTSRLIQRDLKIVRENFTGSKKKITAHVFRHTGATHLRQNGMDLSELQDMLGHSSPSTTRIYSKNDITLLQKSYDGKHPLSKKPLTENEH